MNEYEYINDTIARETAYAEGYEAGKKAIAEEILKEFEEIFTEKLEIYNRLEKDLALSCLKHDTDHWRGCVMTCKEILEYVNKKMEIKAEIQKELKID